MLAFEENFRVHPQAVRPGGHAPEWLGPGRLRCVPGRRMVERRVGGSKVIAGPQPWRRSRALDFSEVVRQHRARARPSVSMTRSEARGSAPLSLALVRKTYEAWLWGD
jgi:hypothetical protein